MKKIFLILLFFISFVLVCCTTSADWDKQYKVAILQELYFLEGTYGKEACDNFMKNEKVLNEIKTLYPEASDKVLEECQNVRKKLSNSYNRK